MLLFLEIKRHIMHVPGRTVITALTAALLVCGMALYMRNIQVTGDALDQLAEQMPVRVKITSRDGASSVNLRIESKNFDALASQDVRDLLCTSAFSFEVKSVNGQPLTASMHVHAANKIAALDGPAPESFTYLEGWDEDFLQADKPVCAVENSYAQEKGIGLGDTISAKLFFIRRVSGGVDHDLIVTHDLTVVALYEDSPAGHGLKSWNATVPIGWLRQLAASTLNSYGDPIPFYYDSASAYLANPREINAFKEAMFQHGFRQQSPLSDRQTLGDALSIDDEMYIKTSSKMIESLQLYNAFLVPFFGLILLTIALITFLTLRSSRRHIAIASSLGRQKLLNAAAPFFGTVIVQAAGCLAALLALSLTVGLLPSSAGMISGAFMLCAAAGTALALVFLFRFDPLALLAKAD